MARATGTKASARAARANGRERARAEPHHAESAAAEAPDAIGVSRHTRYEREGFVHAAIYALTPGSKSGSRSRAWAIDSGTLHAMAISYCVDHHTQERIYAEHKGKCEGASQKSVERWLSSVHEKYRELAQQNIRARAAATNAGLAQAAGQGDLVTVLGFLMGDWAMRIDGVIHSADLTQITKAEHPLMRAIESVTEAAKVQAQAKASEAATQRTLLDVRSKLERIAESARSGRKSGEAVRGEVLALIRETFGIGGAAADAGGEKAA